MPGGHRPGVRSDVDLEADLIRAFEAASPEAAYKAAMAILAAYRESLTECGKLRFQLNFGTARCTECQGLRAGPDVVATCFQVRRCNYTNIKEGDATPRHLRVIQSLLDPKQSP